jgi:hypothetical protein
MTTTAADQTVLHHALPCGSPGAWRLALSIAVALPLLAALPSRADEPAQAIKTKRLAAKPATSRQQLDSEAKGLAMASETVERLNEAQLEIANRVMTGNIECELNQKVAVDPVEGHPGHFHVGFKKAVYTMVPQETTTGAVRLEDKKAGTVWLQIPSKSMLMNSKLGQRMVDGCLHAEQRAVVAALQAAAGAAAKP